MENSSVFKTLRAGFSFVEKHADHVHIDYSKLENYARNLPEIAPENLLDTQHHYIADPASTASYVFTLDAINFGSGYKYYMQEEGWDLIEDSIYFTVSKRLKDHFESNGALSAEQLSVLSSKDLADILKLDTTRAYSAEFAGLCVKSLNELGQKICDDFQGDFMACLKAMEGRAENLFKYLSRLPCFQDRHDYKGEMIGFYKRAQITVVDLQLAFNHVGQVLFNDMSDFTMFADNGVPHVLRIDDILQYSDALQKRIDRGDLIESGSAEETEIRAVAAHAVELIAQIKGLSAVNVDHILWHRSVENTVYARTPTHKTLSIYY